ncbi:hypothetical protein AAHC03_027035 [Spirometra sp. Aus1]
MSRTHFHAENYGALQYCRIRRIEKKIQRSAGRFEILDSPVFYRGRRKRFSGRIPPVEDSLSPGDARRVPLFFSPPHLSPQRYDHQTPEMQFSFSCVTPPPPCLSPAKEKYSTPVNRPHDGTEYTDTLDTDSEASLDAITAKTTSPKSSRTKKKLMPIPPNVRARLLKQSGVANIDESERWACANLRSSRSRVGCSCITTPCDPASCACVLDGVPCQVDKPGFPCNCDSTLCKNPYGHEEFSIHRVRYHIAHVFERLAASGCDKATSTLSTCHGECPTCVAAKSTRPTFLQPAALHTSAAAVSSSGDVVRQPSQEQHSTSSLSPLLPHLPPATSPPHFGACMPVGVSCPTGVVDGLVNNSSVVHPGLFGCCSTPNTLPSVKQSNPHAFSPPLPPKTPPSLTRAGGSFSTDAEVPSSKPFMPFLDAHSHETREPESALTIPNKDLSLLNRLSLRKRRIVRSPFTPTRKRPAQRLHSTPTLTSVLEGSVDSPVPISTPASVTIAPLKTLSELDCTSPIIGQSQVVGSKAAETSKKTDDGAGDCAAVTDVVCLPSKRPLATKSRPFDLTSPMCHPPQPSSNPLGKLNGAC